MNRRSLNRRLDRAEAIAREGMTKLSLDDGRVVWVEVASDLRIMLDLIEAQAAAHEAGRAEVEVSLDDPNIELFARSLPSAGEGTLRASVRHYRRQLLGLPIEGRPPLLL